MADSRVNAAISHWAPRFIANGIDYSDFVTVTSKIDAWDSWCEQWCQAGAVHEELGRTALAAGQRRAAGAHLARAAVYYHFAKFMFVDDLGQMRAAHYRGVNCLADAMPFLDPPGERVEVPFDGSVIAGILRRPAGPGPHPLVVLIPGLDSAKEEFRPTEDVFLSRGLATLSVDGPGQGEAEYDLAIRPDWEVPGTAIIDAAGARPDIDAGRIGIWGVSLGGYYAARVAGGDHRVRATIALCGPYCLGDIWDQLPELSRAAFTARSKSASDSDARAAASQLSLEGVGAKITAPLLIIAGQRDRIFPWQDAERLHQEVGENSELMLLSDGNHGCANVTYKHRNYGADWMAAALA
ncbi:MAG TPA: alpha/beta hydrolase [Streptosporangiaceae bacterium]|nr:alpha/beta hydrolase [Streptosporangiaceae bacterium]